MILEVFFPRSINISDKRINKILYSQEKKRKENGTLLFLLFE